MGSKSNDWFNLQSKVDLKRKLLLKWFGGDPGGDEENK